VIFINNKVRNIHSYTHNTHAPGP